MQAMGERIVFMKKKVLAVLCAAATAFAASPVSASAYTAITAESSGDNEFLLHCTASAVETGATSNAAPTPDRHFDALCEVDVTPDGKFVYTLRAYDELMLIAEKNESVIMTSETISDVQYTVPEWYEWKNTESLTGGNGMVFYETALDGFSLDIIGAAGSEQFAWSGASEVHFNKDDIIGTFVVQPNKEVRFDMESGKYSYIGQDGKGTVIDLNAAVKVSLATSEGSAAWQSKSYLLGICRTESFREFKELEASSFPLHYNEPYEAMHYDIMTYEDGTIQLIVSSENDLQSGSLIDIGEIRYEKGCYDFYYNYISENGQSPILGLHDERYRMNDNTEGYRFRILGLFEGVGSKNSPHDLWGNGKYLSILLVPKEKGKAAPTISVFGDDYTLPELYEYKLGDANGDFRFDLADAVWLQKYLLTGETGDSTFRPLGVWQNADINKDGRLDAVDLTLMKRRLLFYT